MKHTISSLAKFANNVNLRKFTKLSSKRQHELLVAMAYEALESDNFNIFISRYNELHSWADLDRYIPAQWLSEREALYGFISFHNAYSPYPLMQKEDTHLFDKMREPSLWNPVFDVTVMLDQVRSPYNVGSILRIIDNFGFKEMVLTTRSLSLDHPQLKKSARGCERWVPVRYEDDPISWLENAEIPVVGIEKTENAVNISDWVPPESCILIAGNEEHGLSEAIQNFCTQKVQIPMYGFKKSMNVHQALSIISQKFVEENNKVK